MLIYQTFLSSILTRVRVVMFLSCTNSDVISTVRIIILLIVLLICGTIYTEKRCSCNNILFKNRLAAITLI